MSLKKQYLKSKPVCKVTFRFEKKAAKTAKKVYLVGDFNKWKPKKTPMKCLKNGDFTVTVELDTKQSKYQFRYLTNEGTWENDSAADNYIPNGIDGDNSVVQLT